MQQEEFNRKEALGKVIKASAMVWWIPIVMFLSWPIDVQFVGFPLRVWLTVLAPFALAICGYFALKVILVDN